jgi:small subunit ribosomal protein S4
MRKRKGLKRKYKYAFYTKQQLKEFYGKFKEETFRNFFRSFLVGINKRNNSYYSALERRADMFLFRTRLLPTIYAANQYVFHQGVLLNNRYEKSPHAIVRPGTVLSFTVEN